MAGEATSVTPDDVPVANRKLIRPTLGRHVAGGAPRSGSWPRRPSAPEETGAEAAFHARAAGAAVEITLEDGEILRGVLLREDKDALEVQRVGAPDVLVMKRAVLYVCQEPKSARAPSRA